MSTLAERSSDPMVTWMYSPRNCSARFRTSLSRERMGQRRAKAASRVRTHRGHVAENMSTWRSGRIWVKILRICGRGAGRQSGARDRARDDDGPGARIPCRACGPGDETESG